MKDFSSISRVLCVAWLITITISPCVGQNPDTPLSQKHIAKIEKAKSASTKLKLYKKFYTRDSARLMKKVEAVRQRASDSISMATQLGISQKDLGSELTGRAENLKLSRKQYDELVNKYGIENAREIKEQLRDYSSNLKEFESKYGQFNPELYKQSLLAEGKNLLESKAGDKFNGLVNRNEIVGYQNQVDAWKREQFKYSEQLKHAGDSNYLKQQAREKAEQLASDYIQNNPAVLKAAQLKANALMKVYSSVPNSNDLSTAVKRTSLQGRTFRERLVLGGNFQVVTIKPVTVDFFPMVGYKFNSRWVAGVGGFARWSYADSISGLVTKSFGYKGFSSVDVFRNFFAYTEFNRSSTGFIFTEKGNHFTWQNSWLIGVGKKISVSSKLDMTILALYNFFHQSGDPLYPKPLSIRVGFQLSDNALLRKKMN